MKKAFLFTAVFALLFATSVFAQTKAVASLNSQSLNGSTGLYSIPTGHVGWEDKGNFGIDFGYRAIINEDGVAHIPAVTLTFIKMIEISTAFDIQPDFRFGNNADEDNDDLLIGFKIKLPTGKSTAVAIGTNFQFLNFTNDNEWVSYNAYQPYVAITYSGNFFTLPASTTIVFGKTFYSHAAPYGNNSNIDFGMGFDLMLFPDVFSNVVHWIIDFSNFNYSDHSWPNGWSWFNTGSVWRGILNTGFRINLGAIPAMSKFKFVVDFIFNDLFDDNDYGQGRTFTIGVVFGFSP